MGVPGNDLRSAHPLSLQPPRIPSHPFSLQGPLGDPSSRPGPPHRSGPQAVGWGGKAFPGSEAHIRAQKARRGVAAGSSTSRGHLRASRAPDSRAGPLLRAMERAFAGAGSSSPHASWAGRRDRVPVARGVEGSGRKPGPTGWRIVPKSPARPRSGSAPPASPKWTRKEGAVSASGPGKEGAASAPAL